MARPLCATKIESVALTLSRLSVKREIADSISGRSSGQMLNPEFLRLGVCVRLDLKSALS